MQNIILTIFLLTLFSSCSDEKKSSKVATNHPVATLIVEAKNTPVSFIYVAQAQSSHLVNIQARVNGFLDKRVYTEGSVVNKDDVLFVMDKRPFEAQAAAARASKQRQVAAHQTAKSNLDRVRPLAKLNALSQKDLDDAIGTYETTAAAISQAEAQLEVALLNLSYCTIETPIDGITSFAQVQDGTYLNAIDSKLTTVSALDPIWINFSLSDNQLQSLRDQVEEGLLIFPKDGKFKVKVIMVNNKFFPHVGEITFREPYYNVDTGTFLIRATIVNPKGLLRPNQYVRAQVEGAIRPNAILVPQTAVFQSAQGMYVWVINADNKAEYRPVTVGEWQNKSWFITEGLSSGDQVVVDGGIDLSPDSIVTVTNIAKGIK